MALQTRMVRAGSKRACVTLSLVTGDRPLGVHFRYVGSGANRVTEKMTAFGT